MQVVWDGKSGDRLEPTPCVFILSLTQVWKKERGLTSLLDHLTQSATATSGYAAGWDPTARLDSVSRKTFLPALIES
jgi:hypothetical protein